MKVITLLNIHTYIIPLYIHEIIIEIKVATMLYHKIVATLISIISFIL